MNVDVSLLTVHKALFKVAFPLENTYEIWGYPKRHSHSVDMGCAPQLLIYFQ